MAVRIPSIGGIPQIGFGTFPLQGDEAVAAVLMALELGYRHIDTAQMYGNEVDVGKAIAQSDLPRDGLFIVSKVHPENFATDRFLPSIRQSLDELGLARLDLLLLHWPPLDQPVEPVVEALVRAVESGFARAIGVSNFTKSMVTAACKVSHVPIALNQIEFHPLLDQSELRTIGQSLGIITAAFCPLARGAVIGVPVIREIAERHGRSDAQIVLRWTIQQQVVAITMSTKWKNAASNLDVLDFALDEQEMAAISRLGARGQRIVSPPGLAPDWNA